MKLQSAVKVLSLAFMFSLAVFQNANAATVGERVIAVDSLKEVTVIAVENSGLYVVQDLYGNVYANIDASDLAEESGCYGSFCVGQRVIALDSNKDVLLVGLQTSGAFVVRDDYGNEYANITTTDFGQEYGCGADLCVAQRVIAVDSLKNVTVIAIDNANQFTVRDDYGNVYSYIDRSDLAVEAGCGPGLCVGQQVVALDSGKIVSVIAVQTNGMYVVRDQYGNTYANIPSSDLAAEGYNH